MADYENDIPPPGQYLREELAARGLAQRDLAYILGTTEQVVTRLLNGKHGISPDMAKALGHAFDVHPELFTRLQASYDLANAKEPDASLVSRARWQNMFPVRDMINRGWIHEGPSLDGEIARFFGAANANEVQSPAHAARKTNAGENADGPQLAWLYRVTQIAKTMDVKKAYSGAALSKARQPIRAMMGDPQNIQRLPAALADCGIRFVIVEGLPNAKIDGVCTWLDAKTPVIGMSLRFDRIDNFWFVLWHEIIHVMNSHGQNGAIIDVSLEHASDDASKSEEEKIADRGASQECVPQTEMISFLARRNSFISEKDVLFFASQMRVHPGIVVGQIQRRTQRWNFLRKYLVSVREYILSAAPVVDGWGHVASVST
jgi:HTH-type transcriptional regulator/antitoxin HigA